MRHAVDILRDPAIGALVGARTLQQTILNILGKDAPDVQRLIDSGLERPEGARVARRRAAAALGNAASRVMTLDDPIAVTAVLWLRAVGLDAAAAEQVAA